MRDVRRTYQTLLLVIFTQVEMAMSKTPYLDESWKRRSREKDCDERPSTNHTASSLQIFVTRET